MVAPIPAGNQRGVADLAYANLKIDPLLNEIAKFVVQDKVY